jgi:poly(ADP-ribose) glycohydrolase
MSRVPLPHNDKEWTETQNILSSSISTFDELGQAIRSIKPSLVPDVMEHFTLDGLKRVVEEGEIPFFTTLLPFMQDLALRLPKLFSETTLPSLLFKNNEEPTQQQVSLTREQVACLLANMFFCTFGEMSDFHMAFVISSYSQRTYHHSQYNKVRCLLNYFQTAEREGAFWFEGEPIIYQRNTLIHPPNWNAADNPLSR